MQICHADFLSSGKNNKDPQSPRWRAFFPRVDRHDGCLHEIVVSALPQAPSPQTSLHTIRWSTPSIPLPSGPGGCRHHQRRLLRASTYTVPHHGGTRIFSSPSRLTVGEQTCTLCRMKNSAQNEWLTFWSTSTFLFGTLPSCSILSDNELYSAPSSRSSPSSAFGYATGV